ncbi:hypothetical protein BHE74_00021477 [Ensete ventricosum]|nr:hypothetical protein GW17_00015358 [Ensete ventricosum]RWW70818.1 hypothetical protein BHE74_00021477 [Ensete ventricosum]
MIEDEDDGFFRATTNAVQEASASGLIKATGTRVPDDRARGTVARTRAVIRRSDGRSTGGVRLPPFAELTT